MFDNDKENRPRFDTQTGEPIHYDDEIDVNTEEGAAETESDFISSQSNVDSTTENSSAGSIYEQQETEPDSASSQYRYVASSMPYHEEEVKQAQSVEPDQSNEQINSGYYENSGNQNVEYKSSNDYHQENEYQSGNDYSQNGNGYQQNSEYQNANGYQQNGEYQQQNGFQQNNAYQNNGYGGFNNGTNGTPLKTAEQLKAEKKAAKKAAKEKKKKAGNGGFSSGFGKKAAKLVAVALVFGIIAGSSAYGVFYAGGTIFPVEESSKENIQIPTVNPEDLSGSLNNVIDEKDESSSVMNVSSVVKAAMPAIVAINGTVNTGQNYSPYGGGGTSNSSGTGIIVGKSDTELLIVTNAHVVDSVNNLKVVFNDESIVNATVKGSKSDKDIAVIAVSLTEISNTTFGKIAIAELGDSSSVEVGDQVVAIGNALGEGQSVTVGWISALNRSIMIENTQYTGLFMTDAAINPGNSGGALINAQGQVIGINSAKYSSEQVEGMGYAIPVSTVKDIIDNLMNRQTRSKVDAGKASYLGISGVDVTSALSSSYGYPQGIMVNQVVSGSAAEKAGLKKYDIIVSFDDITINSFDKLKSTMEYYAAGETVSIEYYQIENGEYVLKKADIILGSVQ